MLLRIIDIPAAEGVSDRIQIVLEHSDKAESFVIESYKSPVSDNFRKSLAWYFTCYPLQVTKDSDDLGVVEKLIKFGQYMGDELLGEDHQLVKLKEIIEVGGYEKLRVHIESTRGKFFDELWETLILPESKYVLSAVVKEYVRQFIRDGFPNNYSELRYNLKVIPPAQDTVSQLLQAGGIATAVTHNNKNQLNRKPLRILHIVSRPATVNLPFNSSNSINAGLNAIAAGGVLDYEAHQLMSWEQLSNRLIDESKPVHIFHYDGPVILKNNAAHFIFSDEAGNDSLVDLQQIAKVLVDNKVAGLCVDAREYFHNDKPISAAEGLAAIALSAHQQGLGNVIGLGQITNPWTSGQCFNAVYEKIAKGLSLAQAVVEARKALQSAIEISLTTVKYKPFHPWSLLVHYARQSVTFFEEPQTLSGTDDLQGLKLYHEKLFGFRSEMLPPLLNQVGDGHALKLMDRLALAQQAGASQVASIIGESGSGKSQIAHLVSLYLVEKHQIDYGFYFNFTNDDYSSRDILEMIAPVLELGINQLAEVEEKLTTLRCCFILDDIDGDEQCDFERHKSWRELNQFLCKLASSGHVVMILGEFYSVLHELATIKIETSPLPLIEQKVIAANSLRQLELSEELLTRIDNNETWERLLASFKGHPWLTKKMVPLLRSFSVEELTAQVEQHITNSQKNSCVDQFYEWQWQLLKPVWQVLLILSSETRGLLLEMLMTAADQKESSISAKNILKLLGEEDAKLSVGLAMWESSGFLSRLPHGHVVDSRCLPFLATKREACFKAFDQLLLKLNFSQLICEGISLLAKHVVKQPNPAISNNLLLNRRQWVTHFETLWFNNDYRGFFAVKNAFDQLLLQVKLADESKAWTLDLLARSPLIDASDGNDIEAKLSWLALASSVLDQSAAKNANSILVGVEIWRNWFDMFMGSEDRQQLALFQQVANFLERFYISQSQWRDCIVIGEKTYAIYTQHHAWQRVIQSLKTLAQCHYALAEKREGVACENKIMNEIPYTDAPPGFQTQQMLDILLARMARGETQLAQALLDQLRKTDATEKFMDMFEGIQCDIDFQEKNYLAALPYYCKLWARVIHTNQKAQIEHLKPRMMELEKHLGVLTFDAHFEREAPEGTLHPRDYVSSLH